MEGMIRERAYAVGGEHFMVTFARLAKGWTWKTASPCGAVTFRSDPLHHRDLAMATAHVERSLDEFVKSPGRWTTAGLRHWDEIDAFTPAAKRVVAQEVPDAGMEAAARFERMAAYFGAGLSTWIMTRARALEGMGRIWPHETLESPARPEYEWTPDVHFLLELAESVAPPEELPDEFGDVEFQGRDGWKVSVFYDCGELDYIAHFTRPDGTTIDFWDWPDDTPGRGLLIAWRGVGDYERLKREVA